MWPEHWDRRPLSDLGQYINGFAFKPDHWKEDGLKIVRIEQLNKPEGEYDYCQIQIPHDNLIDDGDLVFSWSATLKAVIWRHGPAALNQHLFKVVPKPGVDKYFLHQVLDHNMDALAAGSHGSTMKHIKRGELDTYTVGVPKHHVQEDIADVLRKMNTTIEKTEALIAKYEQIKQGMMQDLFTRGLDEAGRLRPPLEDAPDLYHRTELGLLPKGWKPRLIGKIVDSAIDGPFGSNLKTEHYVNEAGVRVVRLQNIQENEYSDADKAFVSQYHAENLSRHKVVGGDILIAGLGEDSYPVGRACCYPVSLPPAINKADCFRLRCNLEMAINEFVALAINTDIARQQIRRFEQGVTRRRINLGNLRRVKLAMPDSVDEQKLIVQRVFSAASFIKNQRNSLLKLRGQKAGLMQDLLTGKVRVKSDTSDTEQSEPVLAEMSA